MARSSASILRPTAPQCWVSRPWRYLPGTPLDVTQGPGGSLWVAQIGSGQILVLTPSSTSATVDPDIDHDGILNIADRSR